MPIHDWTRFDAGIFHDFRFSWAAELSHVLNQRLLSRDFYALKERLPDRFLAFMPEFFSDRERYAALASWIAVRRSHDASLAAVVEVVSPGTKDTRYALTRLVEKAERHLSAGVQLLVIDLFPPGPYDPQGIHAAIWSAFSDGSFPQPPDKLLTLVAYTSGAEMAAYLEPVAVGDLLPDMPLFLDANSYVCVPLEATYRAAFEAVPRRWREELEPPGTGPA